MDTRESRAIAR